MEEQSDGHEALRKRPRICADPQPSPTEGNDDTLLGLAARHAEEMRWETFSISQDDPYSDPSPRYSHTATVVGDRLFVLGGMGSHQKYMSVHVLDLLSREAPLSSYNITINHSRHRRR